MKTADKESAQKFLVEQGINPLNSTFDPNWTDKLTPWQLTEYNNLLSNNTDSSIDAVAPTPTSAPAPVQSQVSTPTQSQHPTTSGNQGIASVQKALNALKYPGKDTKPLSVDGILGGNTQFAINNYRLQNNIDPSTAQNLVYQYILADAKKSAKPTTANANVYDILMK